MPGKVDVLILGLVAATTAFLFWNSSSLYEVAPSPPPGAPVVPRSIIQAIIEKIQAGAPWLQPVDTIFITPSSTSQGGAEYNGRFLFLDTRGFFGNQYDVTATVAQDGTVQILKQVTSSSPDARGPFQAFAPDRYQSYKDVEDSLAAQVQQALAQTKNLPGLDAYVRT
jgi:hypothetical protein